ncbi:hypothetical protein FOZ62_030055, partial [Perkinsus olseni]
MTFTDETAETVIGYVESPSNEQLRVIDVAQVEFPSVDRGDVKYTVVADEAVLSKYDELLVNGTSKDVTAKPLNSRTMRITGSEIMGEYERHFSGDESDLYCSRQFRATFMRSSSETDPFSCNFKIYLRRPDAEQRFRLTAFKVQLHTVDGFNA